METVCIECLYPEDHLSKFKLSSANFVDTVKIVAPPPHFQLWKKGVGWDVRSVLPTPSHPPPLPNIDSFLVSLTTPPPPRKQKKIKIYKLEINKNEKSHVDKGTLQSCICIRLVLYLITMETCNLHCFS